MSEQIIGENSPGASDTGLAMDLAMEEARADPTLREDVAAFLRDQRDLISVQKHHLQKQFRLIQWEKGLSVLLRGATAVVGIAFAGALGFMIWEASNSNGLLIEPFAVPPDLASRGLSGQVVAGQLLDKLTTMDAATQSYRAPATYANNWGNDIKVEIPQTGVSIGELRRFLREWLGRDTHISGEVWRTESGIAISARAGGDSGATFTGAQSELDALVQKAAEHVYSRTQPFRYGNYLRPQGRFKEAHASYLRLTNSESVTEQGWAWYGIGVLDAVWQGRNEQGLWGYRKAVAAYPDLTIAWSGIGASEFQRGHVEAALEAYRRVEDLINRGGMADIAPRSVAYVRAQWVHTIPLYTGDYNEAIRRGRLGAAMPDQQGFQTNFRHTIARALSAQHDTKSAQSAMRDLGRGGGGRVLNVVTPIMVSAAQDDWQAVAKGEAAAERTIAGLNRVDIPLFFRATLRPWAALAKAKLGDLPGAQALIAAAPMDCYDCVRFRAIIAEIAKQPGTADHWFARAVRDAPSLPFAHHDWGRALLERGQPDAAIEKFKLANQKGPHFADPLEGWGEALMAQNRSHRALAKFAEAEKYAPNWGRLHLKWGQALAYSGDKAEAAKHFARAAQLDLTPSEKSELVRHP